MMVASLLLFVLAQTPAPSADAVVAGAAKEAEKGERRILVQFGASWCGPCHRLEEFLASPKIAGVLKKYFVVTKLDVNETNEKKHLENPGGIELRLKLIGEKAAMPCMAVIDKDKKLYAFNNGDPAGYMGIKSFLKFLATGNPKMTNDDLWSLRREMEARL